MGDRPRRQPGRRIGVRLGDFMARFRRSPRPRHRPRAAIAATPTVERAWAPFSPERGAIRSEAPFITSASRVKSSAQWMKPPRRTQWAIRSRSPSQRPRLRQAIQRAKRRRPASPRPRRPPPRPCRHGRAPARRRARAAIARKRTNSAPLLHGRRHNWRWARLAPAARNRDWRAGARPRSAICPIEHPLQFVVTITVISPRPSRNDFARLDYEASRRGLSRGHCSRMRLSHGLLFVCCALTAISRVAGAPKSPPARGWRATRRSMI